MSRAATLVLVLAIGLSGFVAYRMSRGPDKLPSPSGPRFERSELQPDAVYSEKAELVFPNLDVPVTMKRTLKDGKIRFDFLSMGEVLDSEVYVLDRSSYGLQEMNMESYSPPIPILMFPMAVGEKWEWTGSQESGGRTHKAWATISSQIAKLPDRDLETVHITVNLNIDSTVGPPSERKVEFWFTKGRGIVKRSYGDALARVSLDPGDENQE